MSKQVEYIPGVCNIGPEEIARRKRSGWVGLIVTLVLWGVFVWFNTPAIFRLLIFFPAMASASGFLQAYMNFCAGFGFKGVYNIMKPAGQTETVQQKEFRTKDRQKALQIFAYSAAVGLAIALIAYAVRI
jgi:hypothetical protein